MIMLSSHYYLEVTYQIVRYLLTASSRSSESAIRERLGSLELAVSQWLTQRDMSSRTRLREEIYDLVEDSVSGSLIDRALSDIEVIVGLRQGKVHPTPLQQVDFETARSTAT